MNVWIFDVGRGFCAAIRSPNGYLCLIDCGCSDEFSPVEWLADQEWTLHKGYKLSKLIITHPHIDHLADIETVTDKLKPYMILRRKDLQQDKVTSGGSGKTAIMKHYDKTYMPPEYDHPVEKWPDWGDGFELLSRKLDETKVVENSDTDSAYVNNSSFVTILKCKNYCFAFPGDIESEGMAALLEQSQALRSAISSGVDFFVTPHHGHSSGFSSEWFRVAGATNKFNIASERRRHAGEDESQTRVDSRYSQDDYCEGNNRAGRKLISTRDDGHIHVWINDDGTWGWEATK